MHEQAEYGASTAHWNYKEINHGIAPKGHSADWAKELDKLKSIKNNKEFLTELTEQLFAEQIFAFTPKGDIYNLPLGSTPIDFAYRIHSDLGDRCTGARINGRIVPLHTKLNTSDVVEIIAGKVNNPSRDWLRFTKTSAARQHIRAFLRSQQEESLLALGEEKILAAIEKFNLPPLNRSEAEKSVNDSRLPYNTLRRAMIAVGENALKINALLKIIYPKTIFTEIKTIKTASDQKSNSLDTLRHVRHEFAKCCKPGPEDKVVGYLGREHTIKIHRQSCKRLKGLEPKRFIQL